MSVVRNKIPVSSCMYSTVWPQKDVESSWIVRDFYSSQITAPSEADVGGYNVLYTKDDFIDMSTSSKPLREKNRRKSIGCKHVPHRDKPPQVVERRNARERRRVQAVNNAFLRLRKAVPIQNVRGKRISKVKTLQHAIDYIQALQEILEESDSYHPNNFEMPRCYISHKNTATFENFDFDEDDY